MTDVADADLMAVGQHCQFHPECNQLDFLPFKCSGCKQIFCQEHRTSTAHNCPNAESDVQVIICPICAVAVRMVPNEDPNLTFDRHQRTGCSNQPKVNKKKRCHVKSCKEKLILTNTVICKDCGELTCLRHRLAEDHSCVGPPAAPPAGFRAAFGNLFTGYNRNNTNAAATARTTAVGTANAQRPTTTTHTSRIASAKNKVGSVAKTTSNCLQTQLNDYRTSHKTKNAPSSTTNATPMPAAAGAEQCPQCGQRFSTVQALIDHAASAHTNGWSSGNALPLRPSNTTLGGGGIERCPHCSATFDDPVALVHHVESKHGSKETEVCILS